LPLSPLLLHKPQGKIPNQVPEDVSKFIAIRFDGKRPMVGVRIKNIFYVIWLDRDFTLYAHS
jgi:hypothetical protein